MIELCDECDYSITIADFIATLMTYEKHNTPFSVKIWSSSSELPFEFDSDAHFTFLQEGLRVETKEKVSYIFYDVMVTMDVIK